MFSALPHVDAELDTSQGTLPTSSGPTTHPDDGRPALTVHGPDDERRGEVERFVRAVYERHHGATVRRFAPQLVGLRVHGELIAAAGYRFATEPLFLERYLDEPVDVALGRRLDSAPPRASIVEVGHLAGMPAGAGRRLILALGPHLAAQGAQWVVGTLTQELRQLFVRLGVTPLALAAADPARLGAEARQWGRYYDHAPTVLAGQLTPALRRLEARRARLAGEPLSDGVPR